MFFFGAVVSLLPLAALASPIVNTPANTKAAADYATISKVLNDVITQCGDLSSKAKAFNGDAIDAVPILDSSGILLKLMKEGITKVSGTEAMGLLDSIEVLYPVYNLNTAVDGVVKGLVEKKSLFDKAGLTMIVSDQLEEQKGVAAQLVTAVVSKLPSYLPGIIGTTAAQPILDKLDKAVAAFKAPGH